MQITCEKCSTVYAVDEQKVAGKAARTQCPRCRHLQSAAPQAAAPLMASTEELKCQSCGKPLADAFDEAIGTCAACRAREDSSQGPLDIAGTPTPARAAAILAAAAAAEASAGPPPISSRTPLPRTPLPSSTRTPLPIVPLPEQPPLSAERKRSVLLPMMLLGLLLGAGVAGGYLFWKRTQEQQRLAALPPPLAPEVEAAIAEWRATHGANPGNPIDLLQEARRQFARDTPSGYLAAERAYQKAAVVDPNNELALIGYIQSVALGRGEAIDEATFARARQLSKAMLARTKESPAALLAEANLLLARPRERGNLDRARMLGQKVAEKAEGEQKAEALVVIGRCFAATSAGLAIQSYEEALKLAPQLMQAIYYRGQARAALGEVRLAISDFETRLERDPTHPPSLAAMARIYQEVGELTSARKILERAAKPGEAEPMIELAVHRYQLEGRTAEAIAALRSVARNPAAEPHIRARALAHRAAAERLAGNQDAALQATNEAVKLVPDFAPAHLQLALLAHDRREPDPAYAALKALAGRTGDPGLEGVLTGRTHLLDGKPQEALPAFTEAAKADPRRLDASLLAGAVLARSKRRSDAIAQVFIAVNGDPTRASPRPLPTEYFVQDNELLRGFQGDLQRLAGNADDPMPLVIEGVYRYFLGESQDAEVLFQRATHLDAASSVSYAYRALIAQSRRQLGAAKQLGERAAFHGKQIAIARYANGSAMVANEADPEVARVELRQAQELAPSWLATEVRLAELDRRIGNVDGARGRLQRVIAIDPTYLDAKRLLYALETAR